MDGAPPRSAAREREGGGQEKIDVVIRKRPLNSRELGGGEADVWLTDERTSSVACTLKHKEAVFTAGAVYGPGRTTLDIFREKVRPIAEHAVDGWNGTVFAYGQTSSGKTHTVMGNGSEPGVLSLALQHIFGRIRADDEANYLVRVHAFEIYNERFQDLQLGTELTLLEGSGEPVLRPAGQEKDKQNPPKHASVETTVQDAEEALAVLRAAAEKRHTAATGMNQQSSRGHLINRVRVVRLPKGQCAAPTDSLLNFVDLAGTESLKCTGAVGDVAREGSKINQSLVALGCVIDALSKASSGAGKTKHIPYRSSKLTRVLRTSLGGNTRTVILCCITGSERHLDVTASTLRFAQNASRVKNKPKRAISKEYSSAMVEAVERMVKAQTGSDRARHASEVADLMDQQEVLKAQAMQKSVEMRRLESELQLGQQRRRWLLERLFQQPAKRRRTERRRSHSPATRNDFADPFAQAPLPAPRGSLLSVSSATLPGPPTEPAAASAEDGYDDSTAELLRECIAAEEEQKQATDELEEERRARDDDEAYLRQLQEDNLTAATLGAGLVEKGKGLEARRKEAEEVLSAAEAEAEASVRAAVAEHTDATERLRWRQHDARLEERRSEWLQLAAASTERAALAARNKELERRIALEDASTPAALHWQHGWNKEVQRQEMEELSAQWELDTAQDLAWLHRRLCMQQDVLYVRRAELKAVEAGLSWLKDGNAALEQQLAEDARAAAQDARSEAAAVRATLDGELADLRTELAQRSAKIRAHCDASAAMLRHELAAERAQLEQRNRDWAEAGAALVSQRGAEAAQQGELHRAEVLDLQQCIAGAEATYAERVQELQRQRATAAAEAGETMHAAVREECGACHADLAAQLNAALEQLSGFSERVAARRSAAEQAASSLRAKAVADEAALRHQYDSQLEALQSSFEADMREAAEERERIAESRRQCEAEAAAEAASERYRFAAELQDLEGRHDSARAELLSRVGALRLRSDAEGPDLDGAGQRAARLEAEAAALKATQERELADLRAKCDAEVSQACADRDARIRAAAEEAERERTEAAAQAAKASRLRSEELAGIREAHARAVRELREQVAARVRELEEAERAAVDEENTRLEQEREALVEEVRAVDSELQADLSNVRQAAARAREEHCSAVASLRQCLADAQRRHEQDKGDLRSKWAAQLEELEAEWAAAEPQRAEMMSRAAAAARSAEERARQDIAQLHASATANFTAAVRAHKERSAELQLQHDAKVSQLQALLAHDGACLASTRRECDALASEHKRRMEDLEEERRKVLRMEREREEATRACADLRAKQGAVAAEQDAARRDLEAARHRAESAKDLRECLYDAEMIETVKSLQVRKREIDEQWKEQKKLEKELQRRMTAAEARKDFLVEEARRRPKKRPRR
eukprot:TRINITY_DN39740_c0_g1_i1.p1 TRINITY_DN39740_c0_g1~~TRINITY_DN39740_c0_g1_i1.p1  ORF type:complete len:1409 (+),score=529.60 TRINITY_DN39740_c0_g1_i1:90-4316(+)